MRVEEASVLPAALSIRASMGDSAPGPACRPFFCCVFGAALAALKMQSISPARMIVFFIILKIRRCDHIHARAADVGDDHVADPLGRDHRGVRQEVRHI